MAEPTSQEMRIAGAEKVRDQEPDDPPFFVIIHRDVGGDKLRGRHNIHSRHCWCEPLVVAPEDSRRSVYGERFQSLKRLN